VLLPKGAWLLLGLLLGLLGLLLGLLLGPGYRRPAA
jgi:hypothetical protein